MDKNLFDFSDYKSYLRALAGVGQRKGLRLRMANAAQCQPTYISLVLNGASHLSLEQAEKISELLAHSKEELHYFLLLVQKDRAGSRKLVAYFEEQLEAVRKRRLVLTQRLGKEHTLTETQQATYYSSWIYAAVHIALSIPELQNKSALSRYLQVTPAKLSEVIDFLLLAGLVVEKNGRYEFGPAQVRLGNDSPNIVKHHANWRARATESLERETLRDLHYAGVYSVSRADVLRIKDSLLEEIKKCQAALRASASEELYCLAMDFFSLKVQVD